MSWVNWILVICMYPFVLIMYFCLKNEGHDPKKRVYYGVSLSKEQAEDQIVTEIENTYVKHFTEEDSIIIFNLSETCKKTCYGYAKNEDKEFFLIG